MDSSQLSQTSQIELIPVDDLQPAAIVAQPNGGLSAWLKVLGCFFVFFITWGVAASFGAYQAHYEFELLSSYSSSTISWIGTTQVFLLGLIAVVAGPLYDLGHGRLLLCTGCSLVVFGFFMLSLSKQLWQIVLSQGVCIGLGNGMIYVPAITSVTKVFTTQRPAALGIAATGSAVGGAILPIMFRELTPTIGFGWTNQVFGFMILVISLLAIMLLRSDPATIQQHSKFFDSSALHEAPYLFLCAGLFFIELGYWIPSFTIAPYAKVSLGANADYAFYLLAILNAGSFAGRVLPAYIAQIRRVGPAWVLVAGSLSLGILILSWIAIQSVVGITIWAIFTGFMSGVAVSIPNAVLPKLSPMASIGARSGMMWSFVAFASLIGAPLAGKLVDGEKNSYRGGQLFSGVSICLGAVMLCVPAIHATRKRLD